MATPEPHLQDVQGGWLLTFQNGPRVASPGKALLATTDESRCIRCSRLRLLWVDVVSYHADYGRGSPAINGCCKVVTIGAAVPQEGAKKR